MSEEPQKPPIDPELEARIVALVLGEASDFERDALIRLIDQRPELASFMDEMTKVHALLQDVGAGEFPGEDEDWKMSPERRSAVFAAIDGESDESPVFTECTDPTSANPQPVNPQPVNPLITGGSERRRFFNRGVVSNVLKIAAVLLFICFLGVGTIQWQTAQTAVGLATSVERAADASLPTDIEAGLLMLDNYVGEGEGGGGVNWGLIEKEPAGADEDRTVTTFNLRSVAPSTRALAEIREQIASETAPPSDLYLQDDVQYYDVGQAEIEMRMRGRRAETVAEQDKSVALPEVPELGQIVVNGKPPESGIADQKMNGLPARIGRVMLGGDVNGDAGVDSSGQQADSLFRGGAELNSPARRFGDNLSENSGQAGSQLEGLEQPGGGGAMGGLGGGGFAGDLFGEAGDANSAQDAPRELSQLESKLAELGDAGSGEDFVVPTPSSTPSPAPAAAATRSYGAVWMDDSLTALDAAAKPTSRPANGPANNPANGRSGEPQAATAPQQAASQRGSTLAKGLGLEKAKSWKQLGQQPSYEYSFSADGALMGEPLSEQEESADRPAVQARKKKDSDSDLADIESSGTDYGVTDFGRTQLGFAPGNERVQGIKKESVERHLGSAAISGFHREAMPRSERADAEEYLKRLQSTPQTNQPEAAESVSAGERSERIAGTVVDELDGEPDELAALSISGRDFSNPEGAENELFDRRSTRAIRVPLPPKGLDETSATEEAFSTFSLHVSDVSFKLARAALSTGKWPEASKIRIEEFVNAFDYGDRMPTETEKVACAIEQCVHPFFQQRNLLRVSMRTAAAGRSGDTPLRLTLLLDNSGSMERTDRRDTVRRAFAELAGQLKPIDRVTLISFARRPRLLADQVDGANSDQLVQLVDDLPSEGGTNLESALELAFEKAREQRIENAQNRIILLTDGAVNLGDADPDRLSQRIITMRSAGIAFDAAGISADGLNDEVLEALTRKGDGRYYLLDSVESVDDGFARQVAGALRPSAKNVKIQVEFNPQRVGRYKLLGFEKHVLNKEDFRNDAVDAAEMAAAEAGVALYQFEAKADGEGDIGSVSVRFQDLSTGQMVEKRWPVPYQADALPIDQSSPSLQLAASAGLFAAKLRGGAIGEVVNLKTLSNTLSTLPEPNRRVGRVGELQQMIEQARQIAGE